MSVVADRNDDAPRVLLGNARCAAQNPGAIVVEPSLSAVYGLRIRVQMFPQPTRLLATLLLNFGRYVDYEDIDEALWSHRADGGPLSANQVIRRYLCHIRRGLEGGPLAISTFYGMAAMIGPVAKAKPKQLGQYYTRRPQPELRA